MQDFTFDTFQISLHSDEQPPRVRVSGELAIHEHDDALTDVFRKIHEALLAASSPSEEICVDLQRASYASSRALRAFTKWILWLDKDNPVYRLAFQCNPAHAWQSANAPVFQMLHPAAVRLL